MQKVILCLLLSFLAQFGYSQGSKSAYRQKFTEGNYLMLEQNYVLALKLFKEAYLIDSSSANINYKLGLCYLQSPSEKYKAVYHLEKAVQNVTHNYSPEDPNEKKASDMAYYSLGEAYRLNYNFIASYVYFKKFKDMVGNKNQELTADIDNQMQMNTNAQEFTKDTAKVVVVNLGDSINSPYPDYSPVVSADESMLIFTSRRPGSTGGNKTDDDQFLEDIYVSYKRYDGTWSSAKSIGANINTAGSEANIGLSPDGNQLFVYKDVNGGDIYYSNLVGDTWSSLTPLSSNVNSPDWETHASISVDGSTLYFVSNRKEGGFGGRDIWRCVKLPNGAWSLPTNLGPTINTAADEDAPFLHPDGVTLFFSSKGHKNMGGFDVFKSTRNDEGKWSEPENLRTPINTPDDDIFYVQSADGKRGYVSSVRKGNYGEKDIYRIDFDRTIAEPLTLLKGVLTFNGTKKMPSNVRITVLEEETGQVVQDIKPNELTGKYIMILAPGIKGKTYNVNFEADGYQPISITLVIPPNSSYQEIEKEFMLQMINLETKTLGTMGVKGIVRNKEGKSIPGATIMVHDNLTGKLIETFFTTVDSGSYYFILNRGQNYNISYEAKGYLFHSENINVPKVAEYSVMEKDVVLDKVEIGSKIVLNNIFFDSNKAILRKESGVEIEKLANLMKEYPELVIEVSGHTDSKGNDAANMTLSQTRSQAVVNALVKKGIPKTQLIAKGYGETAPIAPNTLPNGKPDLKGMQQNRRVEMKIVK
ncbi:MAG: PD40 domain-containing protein [Bacteroidetes bacterium]|nr:PD40 domain-containing protein [Bacteroidota bacterium]